MLDTTTFVGLDVHARSIKAVSLDVMTGEVRCATFGYDAGAVAEWVRSVDPKARCVYESGVTGFDLQKRLSGLGVDCAVGAVSKMIKPSADRRRKNDRNDAEFLARMLASIYFSPFSPTYFRQSRQRGCAGFANADAPLSASRLPPPSRPHRRWIRPSGGTTVPLS